MNEKLIRPQLVKLELEDLPDSHTEIGKYIDRLEQSNGVYLAQSEARYEQVKNLKMENQKMRLLLAEAKSRFKQYEMDVDDNRPDHHIKFMDRMEELLRYKK